MDIDDLEVLAGDVRDDVDAVEGASSLAAARRGGVPRAGWHPICGSAPTSHHRAAAIWATLVIVAATGCAGSGKGGSAGDRPPSSAARAAVQGGGGANPREVRLGCGTYCQSAGGYGGGPSGQLVVEVVSTGTVTMDADGYLPVALRCTVPVPCRGAILVDPPDGYMGPFDSYRTVGLVGQSDVLIDGDSTVTIAVPIVPAAVAFMRAQGPTRLGIGGDVRVPPCAQIPQLAAQCDQFVHAAGRTPDEGDGLNRLFAGRLMVVVP